MEVNNYKDVNKQNKNRKLLKHFVIISICIAYIFLTDALNIGCPFRWLTGIPCPACGITRAYLSFCSLDFRGAFLNHPLFWLLPVLVFIGIHKDTNMLKFLNEKTTRIILISGAILFIAVYFIRLFNGYFL